MSSTTIMFCVAAVSVCLVALCVAGPCFVKLAAMRSAAGRPEPRRTFTVEFRPHHPLYSAITNVWSVMAGHDRDGCDRADAWCKAAGEGEEYAATIAGVDLVLRARSGAPARFPDWAELRAAVDAAARRKVA